MSSAARRFYGYYARHHLQHDDPPRHRVDRVRHPARLVEHVYADQAVAAVDHRQRDEEPNRLAARRERHQEQDAR